MLKSSIVLEKSQERASIVYTIYSDSDFLSTIGTAGCIDNFQQDTMLPFVGWYKLASSSQSFVLILGPERDSPPVVGHPVANALVDHSTALGETAFVKRKVFLGLFKDLKVLHKKFANTGFFEKKKTKKS